MATGKISLPYPEAVSIRTHAEHQEYSNVFDIYQVGRMVVFTFQGQDKARFEGQEIFVVHEGYRPRTRSFYAGFLGLTPCIFFIDTDGKCKIYNAPSYPNSRAYVSGAYVI